MKKSFKKAGAAVLSMAMLLSMGAISMPVYAETPGSVTVSIPGAFKQGEGDEEKVDQALYDADSTADLKYDYLDLAGITEANVHMYKVASLGTDGWSWEAPFRGTTQDAHPNSTEGFTTWEALLETLEIRDGDTSENKNNFTSSSADLQKLASYLERTVRNLQAVNAPGSTATSEEKTAAAAALASIEKGTYKTLSPTNTSVTLSDPSSATMNEIGYYLLVTETDESGVIIQPVLVSLKNGKHMNASLKGTKIRIDKSIVDVSGEDDTIADTGDSAVVAKEDTVKYQIKAQLPTYDANVTAGSITPFQIIDTADPGIKLDYSNLKVYLSEDGELDTTEDHLLSIGSNKDYTVSGTSDNGFTVEISGTQMLAQTATSTLKTITTGDPATQKYKNMEGMYIFVVVDATVNDKWTADDVDDAVAAYKAENTGATNEEAAAAVAAQGIVEGDYKFDRTYTAHKTIQDITDADVASVTDSDALSYINRGIYSKEELDAVANATGLKVTGDVADRMVQKVNANGDPVYLNDSNEETTDETQAKKVNGVAVRAEMVDPNGGSNLLKRVKILMARDNANASNGNTNTARMVYGNVYSTGGGSADDEDSTKLFSVDLNLTKYTQKLTLSEANEITDKAGIVAWLGLTGTPTDAQIVAALKEKANTVTTAPASTAYDSDMVTLISGLDDSGNPQLESGDAEKAASLIKAYNDSLDTAADNLEYASQTTKDPVQNAVFKLSKVDDPTDANSALTEIGYAASDAQGNLKVLGTATAEQYTKYKAGTPDTEDSNKIIVKVDDTHYYWYSPDSEDAWIMLTEGTYEIEEVYAPAGYKKNTGGARFTISCAKDSVSEDYTGEFSGSSDSDLFRPLADRETTGSKPTVTFDFVGAEGELQNDMYNALADTLPATGGIGTVLFTAGGISVVLIAGALFVMYMKKRNSEEEE